MNSYISIDDIKLEKKENHVVRTANAYDGYPVITDIYELGIKE